MLAIQFSIGALNDLVDAPLDAGAEARQADPARARRRARAAVVVAVVGGVVGARAVGAVSGLATRRRRRSALGLGYALRPAALADGAVVAAARARAAAAADPRLARRDRLGPAGAASRSCRRRCSRAPALALATGSSTSSGTPRSAGAAIAVALGARRGLGVHAGLLGLVVVLAVLVAPRAGERRWHGGSSPCAGSGSAARAPWPSCSARLALASARTRRRPGARLGARGGRRCRRAGVGWLAGYGGLPHGPA